MYKSKNVGSNQILKAGCTTGAPVAKDTTEVFSQDGISFSSSDALLCSLTDFFYVQIQTTFFPPARQNRISKPTLQVDCPLRKYPQLSEKMSNNHLWSLAIKQTKDGYSITLYNTVNANLMTLNWRWGTKS